MIIPKDFKFNKDTLINYYDNLKQYAGIKITQVKIASLLQTEYPDNALYHALDRKFNTLKFYGFVYFNDNNELMFNEHYEEYVNCLKTNKNLFSCFIKIILSSNDEDSKDSGKDFFELLIGLLKNKGILYLDQIDIISYVQHYELVKNVDELTALVKINRSSNFDDKVETLEAFYRDNGLGTLAKRVHEATYLFSFLEGNGFYTIENSLQSKKYTQGKTPRWLEDKRLYLSKDLLNHINGFEPESIVDEILYNSKLEDGSHKDSGKNISKLIEPSKETEKTIVKRYKTDAKLRNNALENSNYVCEMASLKEEEHNTFPSRMYDGDYVEVHHLIPMHAQENDLFVQKDKLISLDQISNLIVLCPTCHSKLHYGKSSDVKPELELLFENRKAALSKNELSLKKEELLGFYNI